MKKYVYEWYSDRKGLGEEFVFDTEQEAVNVCRNDWESMTEYDRRHNFGDKDGWSYHRVFEIEITQEQLDVYNSGDEIYLTELDTGYTPVDNVYWI